MSGPRVAETLRRSSLFWSLSDDELGLLSRIVPVLTANAGDTVFREGDGGDFFFIIVDGTVRVGVGIGTSREFPIALLGPGKCFGEMSVLDGQPRSATAIAIATTRLVRVDASALRRLNDRFPGSQERILREAVRLLSHRLRVANSEYWELAKRSSRERSAIGHSRDRLMSLVSHELRTPLTIIKSSAQLLLRHGPDAREKLLEKIVYESEHLTSLVTDLVTLSLLHGTTCLQDSSEFALPDLVEEVVEHLRLPARPKNVHLRVDTGADDVVVLADRAMIARALHLLVDNALKLSPSFSTVVVRTELHEGSAARVSVIDHGVGFEREEIEHLSRSFVQEQDVSHRHVAGMSVGLSLVNEIMRIHRGRLIVDSAPGRGSRFTMELANTNHSATEEEPVDGRTV